MRKSGSLPPWLLTLLSYGVAQGVILIGAFIRIPVLTEHLGVRGYGLTLAVSGLAALTLAFTDALTQGTRAAILANGEVDLPVLNGYIKLGMFAGLSLSSIAGLVGVVLLVTLGPDNFWAAFALCAGAICLSITGAPARAWLESIGRTAAAQSTQIATTAIGVPVLVIAVVLAPNLAVASAATGLGLALPYLISLLLMVREGRRRHNESWKNATYRPSLRHLSSMWFWTLSTVAAYSLDAPIANAFAGAEAAASYGVASRIMTLAMVLSLGLGPLVSAHLARVRGASPDKLAREVWRIGMLLGLGSIVLTAVTISLSDVLETALTLGRVSAGLELYFALGAFAVISGFSGPLLSSLVTPALSAMRAKFAFASTTVNISVSVAATLQFGSLGPALGSIAGIASLVILVLLRIARYGLTGRISS